MTTPPAAVINEISTTEYEGLGQLFDEMQQHYQPDTHEVSNCNLGFNWKC